MERGATLDPRQLFQMGEMLSLTMQKCPHLFYYNVPDVFYSTFNGAFYEAKILYRLDIV